MELLSTKLNKNDLIKKLVKVPIKESLIYLTDDKNLDRDKKKYKFAILIK